MALNSWFPCLLSTRIADIHNHTSKQFLTVFQTWLLEKCRSISHTHWRKTRASPSGLCLHRVIAATLSSTVESGAFIFHFLFASLQETKRKKGTVSNHDSELAVITGFYLQPQHRRPGQDCWDSEGYGVGPCLRKMKTNTSKMLQWVKIPCHTSLTTWVQSLVPTVEGLDRFWKLFSDFSTPCHGIYEPTHRVHACTSITNKIVKI